MPIAFSSSLRALAAERGRGLPIAIFLTLALLSAWTAWLFAAEVTLVEVSERARLEALAAAVPVTTLVEGRVARANLGLGRHVDAGELLVELESDRLRLERAALLAHITGLGDQEAAIALEHQAIATAVAAYQRGGRTRTSEAQASAREAAIEADLAASLAARSEELARLGVESSEAEELSRARRRGSEAGAAARRLQVARTAAEVRERVAVLEIELARLERQQVELRGEIARQEAALAVLDRRIDEHRITAPIAGTLGDAPPLHAGAVLAEGATVAQVVPGGELRLVGAFRPAAIGRIRPGQPARIRLDGFPWTEYGSLRGQVVGVGNEAIDGWVRVECSVDPASAPQVPLEHGLTGALEIEVERLTPAALLIRTAGRALRRVSDASPAPAPDGAP